MKSFQDMVRDFHVAFNYPVSPASIELRSAEQRAHLMAEEPIETVIGLVGPGRAQTIIIGELLKAVEKAAKRRQTSASLFETIDGCMDTLVVTFGTLEALGITFEETMLFFAEVHRANMAKKDGPRDPVTDKQLKPPGWTSPDIEGVLARIRVRRDYAAKLERGGAARVEKITHAEWRAMSRDERQAWSDYWHARGIGWLSCIGCGFPEGRGCSVCAACALPPELYELRGDENGPYELQEGMSGKKTTCACGSDDVMVYRWGGASRWMCRDCVGPAYKKWKADEEETRS